MDTKMYCWFLDITEAILWVAVTEEKISWFAWFQSVHWRLWAGRNDHVTHKICALTQHARMVGMKIFANETNTTKWSLLKAIISYINYIIVIAIIMVIIMIIVINVVIIIIIDEPEELVRSNCHSFVDQRKPKMSEDSKML